MRVVRLSGIRWPANLETIADLVTGLPNRWMLPSSYYPHAKREKWKFDRFQLDDFVVMKIVRPISENPLQSLGVM